MPLQVEKLRKHRPREGARILEGIGGVEVERSPGRGSPGWTGERLVATEPRTGPGHASAAASG